jgi:ankyrin repeat protein
VEVNKAIVANDMPRIVSLLKDPVDWKRITGFDNPLETALCNGRNSMAILLVRHGIGVNIFLTRCHSRSDDPKTPLPPEFVGCYTVRKRNYELLDAMADHSLDLNYRDSANDFLLTAAAELPLDTLKGFVGRGMDIERKDRDGVTEILRQIRARNHDAVKKLFDLGADPFLDTNSMDNFLSHLITEWDPSYISLAEEAIKRGVSVNETDETPPLFFAVMRPDKDLIELLLKNGADPNARTREGRTIFDFLGRMTPPPADPATRARHDEVWRSIHLLLVKYGMRRPSFWKADYP